MGKRLGDADDPLLVSVRSGAKFSMPGMMDTVLNIGLNDESVAGLARQAGSDRFAWDSYRRLLQMFGKTVLGVDGDAFEHVLEQAKRDKGTRADLDLDAADLQALVRRFQQIVQEPTGEPFPQDPRVQLDLAVRPSSTPGTPTAPGCTAARSASRPTSARPSTSARWCSATSAWTPAPASRSPATRAAARRASTATTCRTRRARTSSPASATPCRCRTWRSSTRPRTPSCWRTMETLERHYRDLCDIEFTIERGKLWMLQTRVGKRTAGAAFRIATQLVDEGLISQDEALLRVAGAQLAAADVPALRVDRRRQQLTKGMGASPGAAVGRAVFDSDTAVAWAGARRGRHPGPPRDQPRRPRRHDRRAGHPHQPRRQDQPRRRRRPRHGQDLRLRRRGARGRRDRAHRHRRRHASWARATCCRSTAPPARSSSARSR